MFSSCKKCQHSSWIFRFHHSSQTIQHPSFVNHWGSYHNQSRKYNSWRNLFWGRGTTLVGEITVKSCFFLCADILEKGWRVCKLRRSYWILSGNLANIKEVEKISLGVEGEFPHGREMNSGAAQGSVLIISTILNIWYILELLLNLSYKQLVPTSFSQLTFIDSINIYLIYWCFLPWKLNGVNKVLALRKSGTLRGLAKTVLYKLANFKLL